MQKFQTEISHLWIMNFSWLMYRMKEIVDKYLDFRYKGHFKKSQCKKSNSTSAFWEKDLASAGLDEFHFNCFYMWKAGGRVPLHDWQPIISV